MNEIDVDDYSYLGLLNHGAPLGSAHSLGYLIALADSPDHKIAETLPARRVLRYLFDIEEQSPDAFYLMERQQSFCLRFFPGGYLPQTPVMLTKSWSPISAILERGFNPVTLIREQKTRAVATGIWEAGAIKISEMPKFDERKTDQEFFWAVINEAVRRAHHRGMYIRVIASPGWGYETKFDSLPRWTKEEVVKADGILWRRTPGDKSEGD